MNAATGRPVIMPAPAKVNLYLHITGRRDDGYHMLDSLVAFADDGDDVRVKPSDRFSFTIDGLFAGAFDAAARDEGPDSANLVVRAVRGLAALLGREPAAAVHLTKNLPLAAGLGGGSADAAAAIKALLKLWEIDPAAVPGFDAFLLSLGADVPVCWPDRAVRVTGIGEECTPVDDIPPLAAILVNPGLACPTPDVFARYQGPFTAPLPGDIGPAFRDDPVAFLTRQDNDLSDAACAIVPAIAAVLAALGGQDGCRLARLSGSGASCFGLFDDLAMAQNAAQTLAAQQPGWWVQAVMLR